MTFQLREVSASVAETKPNTKKVPLRLSNLRRLRAPVHTSQGGSTAGVTLQCIASFSTGSPELTWPLGQSLWSSCGQGLELTLESF